MPKINQILESIKVEIDGLI